MLPLPLLQAHSWGPLEQILAEPGDLLLDLSDLQCDSCPGFVPLFGWLWKPGQLSGGTTDITYQLPLKAWLGKDKGGWTVPIICSELQVFGWSRTEDMDLTLSFQLPLGIGAPLQRHRWTGRNTYHVSQGCRVTMGKVLGGEGENSGFGRKVLSDWCIPQTFQWG